jgi:hypothetical protein
VAAILPFVPMSDERRRHRLPIRVAKTARLRRGGHPLEYFRKEPGRRLHQRPRLGGEKRPRRARSGRRPERRIGDDLRGICGRRFEYLQQYVKATPGDVLENFLGLLQQYRTSQVERPLGLEGLDRIALELLGDLEG